MANITVLHWNIEQFSLNKLNNANGGALINYIARVILVANADIVAFIEVKNSAVGAVVANLSAALHAQAGGMGANPWTSVFINSQKNNEAYLYVYRTDRNFQPVFPGGFGPVPLSGLSSQTIVGGVPGGYIRFNSSMTKTGGRRPFFATFRTTDTMQDFSVVSYHTMFGYWKPIGVASAGLLAQSRVVTNAGVAVNMSASFTCGDFNIDFLTDPGPYANLLAMPSTPSANARTSLVNNTPPLGWPTSVQYRLHAYDNIFRFQLAGAPPAAGTIADLINESATAPVGTGLMAAWAGAFVRGPIPNGVAIVNIPPQDFEDSWHIVRHAISNHLPVFVSMVV